MANRVLVIDDDTDMLALSEFHLRDEGYEVATAATGAQGLVLAAEKRFDVALVDLNLPDQPNADGMAVVSQIKQSSPETEIIVVTGFSTVTKAVDAIKAGAFYFVEKPVEFEELVMLIGKAVERGQQATEIKQLRGRLKTRDAYFSMIGSSKAMQDIYETIDSVADSDANILIVGESGTGKELIANAIHFKSLRTKKPFVKINCSALPKELIESELFGHTKGAFTGAASDKIGLIGQAEGGSLMLDEIGEMPLDLQPKLLRVLQERVYFRLGSEKPQMADFRLISATNRNPLEAVRDGVLREDLFYRINTIEIRVPPLKERADDIPHLASHFLQEFGEKYGRPIQSLSQLAYEKLFNYAWPGNVRELQNVMERAVLLTKGEIIDESVFPFEKSAGRASAPAASRPVMPEMNGAAQAVAAAPIAMEEQMPAEAFSLDQIGRVIVSKVPDPAPGTTGEDVFKQLEVAVVTAALERTRGNKQAAAALLGLYRPRLYSMIKRHNLNDNPR
jgi:DNA-binding NtrC family response regulator